MAAPTHLGSIHGTPTEDHDVPHAQFKAHKVLPRPRDDRAVDVNRAPSAAVPDLAADRIASMGSPTFQRSSPRALKHQSRRIGSGPELPPTPPNHSRVSSGSHPAHSPSPSSQDAGVWTPQPQVLTRRPPATPPDQRSPPTPDVTPPQLRKRPNALRSLVPDHGYSCNIATTYPQTKSCRTAGEEPSSHDDGAATYTENKTTVSSPPSQTPVRLLPVSTTASQAVQPHALDLILECLSANLEEETYTPRIRCELGQSDDELDSPGHVEMECDIHLQRQVSASNRKLKYVTSTPPQLYGAKKEVPGAKLVTLEQATRAIRNVSPKEVVSVEKLPKLSPQSGPRRRRTESVASSSETSSRTAPRRSHGPSTVIEAMLIDNTSPLQKQRTLRHMRKRRELREPSPRDRQVAGVDLDSLPARISPSSNTKGEHARRHDSYTSATSLRSAVSRRARKEVWKAGGIPVVVIPDRISSHKSESREPSLRSSSSRHSRTRSAGSSALTQSLPYIENFESLSFDRQSRWDRSTSVSDRSDQRTMDFPPTIPPRSSSLSAPTTRTTSRSGSLTVESIKALNDMHCANEKVITLGSASAAPITITETTSATHIQPAPEAKATVPTSQLSALLSISNQPSQIAQSELIYGHDAFDADHQDETASAEKYSPRMTPFSVISLDTNWTVPEISEAQAVHMYHHQNSSVLRINHCFKPQGLEKAINQGPETSDSRQNPQITTLRPEGNATTPEQQQSWEEVDSPLRNPRTPPDTPPHTPMHPPAINFIPATPSGLTPAEERQVQLGNFYEVAAETPIRRTSFVRRALSKQRRHSFSYPPAPSKQPGFLARSFSLSRGDRKLVNVEKMRSLSQDKKDSEPAEQDKLHPHWRPQWDNDADDCDCSSCRSESEDEEEIYRYPLVDNRPRSLKRSLSAKVKNTFAILPARQDYQYYMDDAHEPERRTIRRTPSGNLKVMRRRSSDYSLRRQTVVGPLDGQRQISKGNSQTGFWRRYSLRRRRSTAGLQRSSSFGNRFGELPSLTRRWNEKRREKRTQHLRQTISGPREVCNGVGDVVRLTNMKNRQVNYSYKLQNE
ncbi:hypothetical protein E4U21_006484 [Claviceps maximensis]|nr:hypothetical protein E4U21_006484 [Claviceps maximensis]